MADWSVQVKDLISKIRERLTRELFSLKRLAYSAYLWLLWIYTTVLGRTPILLALTLLILTWTFSTLFSHLEHINFFKAIYWTIITITTVGYGDIVPKTWLGRVLAMIVAITGFSVLTVALSIAAHHVLSKTIIEREGGGRIRGSSVIIVGTSSSCVEVAERLRRLLGKRSRIVWVTTPDMPEKYIMMARSIGVVIIKGELTQIDTYLRADILKCNNIIICGRSDKENVAIALVVKSFESKRMYPPTLIAITYTKQGEKILTELVNVDIVVSSKVIGQLFMESFDDTVATMFLSALSEGHPNLLEVKLFKAPFNLIFARVGSSITLVGRGDTIDVATLSRVLSKVRRSKVYIVARVKNIMEVEPLRPSDYLDPEDVLVAVEFKPSSM